MKHILWENGFEAWALAVKYSEDIESGLVTLLYRKQFVSCLHNAVELMIKQYMLDINDHRVVRFKKVYSDGEPARSFYNSNNLNALFLNNSTIRDEAYSIEFSELIDCQKKLFSAYYESNENGKTIITRGMKTLNRLRNMETHFFISDEDFLTEKEFCELYEFMIEFYKLMKEHELLPFWGEPLGADMMLAFDKSTLNKFSYREAILSSSYYSKIKIALQGQICLGSEDVYMIVEDVLNAVNCLLTRADYTAIFSVVSAMLKYKLLEIATDVQVVELDDGKIIEQPYYWYETKKVDYF